MSFRPENDGIDHINAYSKARTKVGRLLTNYARSPFKHKTFGEFESMEGFWFWLASGRQYNRLRKLHGYDANQLGRICLENINYEEVVDDRFRTWIEEATKAKLRQNTDILQMLVETGDLPIVHYYYDYKNPVLTEAKVTFLPQHQWQMEIVMDVRKKTQEWMKRKGIVDISKYKLE